METEREWEFKNKEIQTRKSGKENEWHIGLYRNLTTNKWTWINGKTETLNKWHKDKPQNVDFYVLMAKESSEGLKGSFRSIKRDVRRGWICEEETGMNTAYQCLHPPSPANKTNLIAPPSLPSLCHLSIEHCDTLHIAHCTLQHTDTDEYFRTKRRRLT